MHLIPIFNKTFGTGQEMGKAKIQGGKRWISTTWFSQSTAAIEIGAQQAAKPGSNTAG